MSVTNLIIFSQACCHRLLAPTVHFTSLQSLSGAQPAITMQTCEELIANEEQKRCLFMAQPQAPICSSLLPWLFFSYFSYLCFFCSSSSYLSTWITPGLRDSDRIACMRCLNCAALNFGARPHIIMCMRARKLFRASEPIKGLKEESHM